MPRAGLFAELRRRHVWRVAVAYSIAGWLLVQVATQVFPFFDIPNWAVRLVVVLVVACFPVAMALAWVYEITPEGIRRTEAPDSPDARPAHEHRQVKRRLNAFIAGAVMIAVALVGWRVLASRHAPASVLLEAALVNSPGGARQGPASIIPDSAAGAAASGQPGSPDAAQRNPGSATAQAIPAKSVAVLPFENLSDDKQNEYFVAGIQDLILTRLADIGDLKVISRTSTARYGSRPENLRDIALQLGVATILEGSVQKAGDRVLINVKLIDARNDSHVWGQDYARKLDDIFGVEGEVAEKIAAALKAKLSPEESARLAVVPTGNQAAYDLFLRAQYHSQKGDINDDTAGWKRAIPLYRQAVEEDPAFAIAWARLSMSESMLAWYGGGGEDPRRLRAEAHAHALQALKIAPELAAPQLAFAYSEYRNQADYPAALRAFAKVLASNPNDAEALAGRAFIERRQGHFGEALASLQKAFVVDPRDSTTAFEIGYTNLLASRFSEAEQWFQRTLAIDPDKFGAKVSYSDAILFSTGDATRALAAAEGDEPALRLQRVKLLRLQRNYADALVLLDHVPGGPDNFSYSSSPNGPKSLLQGDLYRRTNDTGKAKSAFARALAEIRAQAESNQGINRAISLQQVASAEVGLGDIEGARSDMAKSLALVERLQDYTSGPQVLRAIAALYAEMHQSDLAVPLLGRALSTPGIGAYYAPALLWLDPEWDPIRHDPRFQALLEQYATYKPAMPPEPGAGRGQENPP